MTDTPPAAAAGWYPVPGGGKRFWNGREWTSDVIGAPTAAAEYAALSPDLPAPNTLVLAPLPRAPERLQPFYMVPPAAQPPGWYPGQSGMIQWWDGQAWGPFAPQQLQPAKEVGIAYIFLLLLGGFSAHRFYLGRIASAVAFLLIWWGGWLLSAVLIGIPLVIAGAIWLLVDLFILPSMVRDENAARLRRV